MKNFLPSLFGANKTSEQQIDEKHDFEKQTDEKQELLNSVNAAKEEWLSAQIYFENVSDPDLVDLSIYKLEAARRKYMYLLKVARNEGVEDGRILERNNKIVHF